MYGYGGNLYDDGGFTSKLDNLNKFGTEELKPFLLDEALGKKEPYGDLATSIFDGKSINDQNKTALANKVVPTSSFNPKPFITSDSTIGNSTDDKKSKFDLAKALQFAPAAGALLNRANLKKPKRESRAMISNKFQKDLMDEMRLQNIASNEFNNTAEAIANASGGSKAATRAGILGAGLNRNLALSRAYGQADDVNRQQSNMAQQFDFGVDRVNLYQDNLMKEVNARNEGAYETEKSRLNDALFNSLGNISKEIIDKRTVAKMFGYSWDGKYMKDKQGNVIPPDVLQKQIEELKKKQNGG